MLQQYPSPSFGRASNIGDLAGAIIFAREAGVGITKLVVLAGAIVFCSRDR
jgi:hypothetical protein